ncbi:MAG: hypothetical protein J6P07_07125, partial [Spirochaetaceae bacterium]|nr:hypothetical protein [Spirochaetaceae bacterium]
EMQCNSVCAPIAEVFQILHHDFRPVIVGSTRSACYRKQLVSAVILAEAPLDCVAIGAGKSFELEREISSDRSIYDMLNN